MNEHDGSADGMSAEDLEELDTKHAQAENTIEGPAAEGLLNRVIAEAHSMAKKRHMPAQKPATSEQVVVTDPAFIEAVQRRFGPLTFDLAALDTNKQAPEYFGPDHVNVSDRDALAISWSERRPEGNLWLNPEFADLRHYSAKCAEESKKRHGLILLLSPASVGSNWFQEHCLKNGHVLLLNPRLQFVGHMHPYPKDLSLTVFGYGLRGIDTWRWK
jgi:hypothetical protein